LKIYILKNSKGISVLFLIIAMMLMVTIGYVFSYLIPTKQKSVSFPIYSNQAFFIAQSGVEYAVRYSADQGWTSTASLLGLNAPGVNQRNLGGGNFTISYNNLTNKLTSIGVIPNVSERRIVVSSFTSFLTNPMGLILDPRSPSPCWSVGTQVARFYIRNASENNVTLTRFSATWTQNPPVRRIQRIDMDGVQKYAGNYRNGDPPESFNLGGNSQTLTPDQVITVLVYWGNNVTNGANIAINIYPAVGNGYTFFLDPGGAGLPNC